MRRASARKEQCPYNARDFLGKQLAYRGIVPDDTISTSFYLEIAYGFNEISTADDFRDELDKALESNLSLSSPSELPVETLHR